MTYVQRVLTRQLDLFLSRQKKGEIREIKKKIYSQA